MRIALTLVMGLLLFDTGCVQAPRVETSQPGVQPSTTTVAPDSSSSQADISAEVEQLRAALLHEVPQHTTRTEASDRDWIVRAKASIAAGPYLIDRPQLIVVIDRNPGVQRLCIILAQSVDAPWQVIGGSKTSTGQAGRHGYFITPTGVFLHTVGIMDYRALGTFNENHIRGLGLKDMRVWDFGWQSAEKGWLADREQGEIRLLLHATDPDYLEQRLGRAASKGCVRIPASMNRFLDLHGVLDADYERAASEDRGINALLLPDRRPTRLAGIALVVIDSSQPASPSERNS